MNTQIEDLLSRLEELNAQALTSSDPLLQAAANIAQFQDLLQQRGELIARLQPVFAANAPVSYVEWNRLVVIHRQGARIDENLQETRRQLSQEVGSTCSGRVFLDRMAGMLAPVA